MDLQSYIELKKKYASMNVPQPVNEEVEVVDEEEILSEEDLEESRATGSQRRANQERIRAEREARSKNQTGNVFTRAQAEVDKARAADRRRDQEITDQARKIFGKKTTAEREAEDKSAGRASEVRTDDGTSVRYTRQSDGSTRRKGQMATLGGQQVRWNVDASGKGSWRNSKGETVGGGSSSLSTNKPNKPNKPAKPEQPSGGGVGGGSNPPNRPAQRPNAGAGDKVPGPSTVKIPPRPASAKPQTGDKAKDMDTWAKANPKLAAAQKQRAATRGTTASSNPLMKGMGRTPPKATTPTTPKATPFKPSGSGSTPKFNPNAPKIKLNNSVEVDFFDIILEYLVDSGFPQQEALVIMSEMSEEKRDQILSLLSEEEADKLRDKRQERGGVDGNKRYPGFASSTEMKKHGVPGAKTAAQREAEEKYGKGATAMDIVKAQMEKKYGKGAIMDPKDKKKKD